MDKLNIAHAAYNTKVVYCNNYYTLVIPVNAVVYVMLAHLAHFQVTQLYNNI